MPLFLCRSRSKKSPILGTCHECPMGVIRKRPCQTRQEFVANRESKDAPPRDFSEYIGLNIKAPQNNPNSPLIPQMCRPCTFYGNRPMIDRIAYTCVSSELQGTLKSNFADMFTVSKSIRRTNLMTLLGYADYL